MITLTNAPSPTHTPEQAFRAASIAVNTLVKRIRRHYPRDPFEYLLVWELHKNGYPHAHLLVRSTYIPQHVLSAWWTELTGNPVVDVRRAGGPWGAARYVSKYLTKSLAVPPNMKHWRTSRSFWPTPGGMFPRQPQTDPPRYLIRHSFLEMPSIFHPASFNLTRDGPSVLVAANLPQDRPVEGRFSYRWFGGEARPNRAVQPTPAAVAVNAATVGPA